MVVPEPTARRRSRRASYVRCEKQSVRKEFFAAISAFTSRSPVSSGTFREETGDLLVKADIAAKNSFRTDCFSHRTYDARRDRRRAVGSGTTIIFLLEL